MSLSNRACANCGSMFTPARNSARYCSRPCVWANNGGHNRTDDPVWQVTARGYVQGWVWEDGKRVQVKQHRWLMEQHLGRPLRRNEVVHHKNHVRADNRLENLEVMTRSEHMAHHRADDVRIRAEHAEMAELLETFAYPPWQQRGGEEATRIPPAEDVFDRARTLLARARGEL